MENKNKNVWYIPPEGSRIQRTIINTLNFLIDIVFETIVKPQETKVETHDNKIVSLENENFETLNTITDLQFENNVLKDEVFDNLNQTVDLEFRVSQLEDKETK